MTPNDTPAAAATTRGRVLNVTRWVVQVLVAAAVAFAGINLLPGLLREAVEHLDRTGVGPGFRCLTASL